MSPAPKGNKNASKSQEEKKRLILEYIEHRRKGYSKRSFPPCHFESIETYIEEVDFVSLKKDLDAAEREGRMMWEEIGNKIAKGELKGNPAVWIFTMKNKFGDEWKDKAEVEHSGDAPTNINIIVDSSETAETLKRLRNADSPTDERV